MRTAIEIAAQVWCDPRCANIEMDSRLAEVFAEEIQKFIDVTKAAEEMYRGVMLEDWPVEAQNRMKEALAKLNNKLAGGEG